MPETVTVYFDYLCPFAWRGAEVADIVAKTLELDFVWRHFSLYQSNHKGQANWQLWNEKIDPEDDCGNQGLLPFLASCAARCQGEEKFNTFRLAALRARHCERKAFNLATLFEVAEEVALHLPRFERDLWNPEFRTMLAQEHYQAAALDVFGTPTFCFDKGHAAYFRIAKLPHSPEEAIDLFKDYRHMLETYPYLETIKRPRPKRN